MPADLIDWDVAVSTARMVMRPGPEVSPDEARAVTLQLRELVPIAERHVQDFTGLVLPDLDIPVQVVDRIGWVQANVDGFRLVVQPLVDAVTSRRAAPTGLVRAVGAKVTGVQVGTLMAYLGARVLGQFELFLPPGEDAGRLTLVAPNIIDAERRLGVDPDDFRLWVALHEVTHKTQFTAVPWLRDYFMGLVREFIDASELDPAQLVERLRGVASAVRGAATGGPRPSVVELLQSPQQREVLVRVQALMSLLEGHGDYVMDGVGPTVVPTAELIRERFDNRRKGANPIDRLIRSLFGMDLKMQQYAEGEKFVRHVAEAVGMAAFNTVWTSPETLPDLAEIRDPAAWLARVVPPRDAVGSAT